MIIVEGADGTGKTTLSKLIAKKLSLEYVKIPRTKYDSELNGFKFYMQQVEQLPLACVVDRFHLGEFVYPQLYEDDLRTPLKLWQLHAIERALLAKGAMLIYVSAEPDWIIGNLQARNEAGIDLDYRALAREQELFAECVASSLLFTKYFITDLSTSNNDIFMEFMQKHEQFKRKRAFTRLDYRATGSTQNPIVLVGDKVNPKYETQLAFNAWQGGSAYLHEALSIAGFNYSWYLTNSTGKSPSELVQEISSLQPVKVIALGTQATSNLQNALIPHTPFEHPAHHRRFNHNVYAYAHQLQQLVW